MSLAVRLLGTGNPFPNLQRRGPATLVEAGDARYVVDTGEGALGQLLRAGVPLESVEHILLTHFHSDHTVGFSAVVIGSWTAGRKRLWLGGPRGMADLWQRYAAMFDHDIEYRVRLGWPEEAMRPEVVEVVDAWSTDLAGTVVSACVVPHVGPHCVGYRFDRDGASVVISGDTAYSPRLVELARGADVLVNNCSISKPREKDSPDPVAWGGLRNSLSDHVCTPQDAGRMAREAGVGTLVLTHMQPETDPQYVRARVSETGFAGQVLVGEDLLRLDVGVGTVTIDPEVQP